MPFQVGTPFDRATRGLTGAPFDRATRGLWVQVEIPAEFFRTPDASLMAPVFATATVFVTGDPIVSLGILDYPVLVMVSDPDSGVAYTRVPE